MEDYKKFVASVKEKSLYQTGTTAKYRDKLLTLSTCEYSQKNGRMVLVAKKITENYHRSGDDDHAGA